MNSWSILSFEVWHSILDASVLNATRRGFAIRRLALVFRVCSLNVEGSPQGNFGARQEEVVGALRRLVILLLILVSLEPGLQPSRNQEIRSSEQKGGWENLKGSWEGRHAELAGRTRTGRGQSQAGEGENASVFIRLVLPGPREPGLVFPG